MKDAIPLVKIKDISTKIGSGATPRGGKESYKDVGISLIRSLNVYDYKFELKNLAKIDEYQAQKLRNVIVEKNDILLNITGASVARCTIVPDKILPARVNQHVSIIRIKKDLADAKYVLNTINSNSFKNGLLNLAYTGATREALTKDDISNFKIPYPPLPIQKKIAAILSAYDELIENNNRRIAILEKMAEEIYREWFVRLRFPGHEKVKVVKGVPEGWEIANLGTVVRVNELSLRKNEALKEIKYIDISAVTPGKIGKVETISFSDAPGRARRIVRHGDVIWSCVRPNRRSFALIYKPTTNTICSTGFAVLTAKKIPYSFLYFIVTTEGFTSYLTNRAKGSAYPAVSVEDFENAEIILPSASMLNSFHKIIEPFLSLKEQLKIKNTCFQQSRDLLLPRLISGKLDVEKLDIAYPPGIQSSELTDGKEAEAA